MHRLAAFVLVTAVALTGALAADAGPVARITIRHQVAGCHTWSVDGGAWAAHQSVRIAAGGTIAFVNDDVMTHRLVELSGPHLVMPPTMLEPTFKHPGGGNVTLTFPKPGLYELRTVHGDESGKVIDTTGPDNVLRLTVRVV